MRTKGSVLFSAAVFKSGETHAAWGIKLDCSRSMVTKMVSGTYLPKGYALRMKISNFAAVPPGSWDSLVDTETPVRFGSVRL